MTYHIKEFYAAVLSLEDKEDKRNILCSKIREAGINIKIPDINNSTDKFEVVGEDILYGLNQIKGLGAAKLPIILKNKPYASLEDAYNKNIIGKKKYFDKKTGEALIKAGAFDFEDSNRNALLNKFIDIRKAKKDEEIYDENSYDEMTCMQYEMEVFGSSISHISKWDNLEAGKSIKTDIYITSIKEKIDKNNNMMAFIEADIKPNKKIQGIIFASVYCRNVDLIKLNTKIPCQIKKDENGKKFIVSKIFREKMISETNYYNVYDNII